MRLKSKSNGVQYIVRFLRYLHGLSVAQREGSDSQKFRRALEPETTFQSSQRGQRFRGTLELFEYSNVVPGHVPILIMVFCFYIDR